MTAPPLPRLRSLGIAKLLKGLIWGLIPLNLIRLLASFVEPTAEPSSLDDQYLGMLVLILCFIVFFLFYALSAYIGQAIWLFKLHEDLKEFYPDYPISPWRATLTCSLPVVSLLGIWDVTTVLCNHLQQSPNLKYYGKKIADVVRLAYLIAFVPGLWVYIELWRIADEPAIEHVVIHLADTTIGIILMGALLSVLQNVTAALKELARGADGPNTKIKVNRFV